MTVHDDDIGGLFKAIGGKNNQFKEFSKLSEAAQERWPLFKTVGVEKRPPPPQLLQSEKAVWQHQAPPPPLPASKAKGLTLGNKIARGLNKLGHGQSSVPPHPSILPHSPNTAANTASNIASASAATSAPAAGADTLPVAARRALPAAEAAPANARRTTSLARPAPASNGAPRAPLGSRLFGAAEATAPEALAPAGQPRSRSLLPGAAAGKAAAGKSAAPGPAKSASSGSGLFARTNASAPASEKPITKPITKSITQSITKPISKPAGKSRSGLFAAADAAQEPSRAAPLFGKADESAAGGKKLFGGAKPRNDGPGTNHGEGGNLSSLFQRLGDGSPPAGGKHRGLFNRNG